MFLDTSTQLTLTFLKNENDGHFHDGTFANLIAAVTETWI